jgi:hypothetical protein
MVLPSGAKQKEGCVDMVLPLLARVAATAAAGYGMKKIDDEETANRKAREDRKAARSGKSGDPRSRGRRKPDSYTDIDPVTGIERLRTIENARDDARYYSNRKNDYLDKREKGEPYSLAEIQEGNRQFKSDKEDAARRKAEVKAAKEAVEGMKKGGVVKRSRGDGIAQRGKTKGRIC